MWNAIWNLLTATGVAVRDITAEALEGLIDFLYQLLGISVLVLVLSLAVSGLIQAKGFLPYVCIAYVLVVLAMLMARRTLRAAGLLFSIDVVIDIFRSTTPISIQNLGNLARLNLSWDRVKRFATLQLVGRLVFAVVCYELAVLFIFSFVGVWRRPNLVPYMIMCGMLALFFNSPWGRDLRLAGLGNLAGLVGFVILGIMALSDVENWGNEAKTLWGSHPLWVFALAIGILAVILFVFQLSRTGTGFSAVAIVNGRGLSMLVALAALIMAAVLIFSPQAASARNWFQALSLSSIILFGIAAAIVVMLVLALVKGDGSLAKSVLAVCVVLLVLMAAGAGMRSCGSYLASESRAQAAAAPPNVPVSVTPTQPTSPLPTKPSSITGAGCKAKITYDPRDLWYSPKIEVHNARLIHIEPVGLVKPDPSLPAVGPAGREFSAGQLQNNLGFPKLDAHVGALLVRVEGVVYEVRGPLDIPINCKEGRLDFAVMINDRTNWLFDNSGNFQLAITLIQ